MSRPIRFGPGPGSRDTSGSVAEWDTALADATRGRPPDWFVPWTGFRFMNRDALVCVLGYGCTNGLPNNTLVGAMKCGEQWVFVDLSTWGDEWAHSAPMGRPLCKACLRVDCPTVGGVAEACAPITYTAP